MQGFNMGRYVPPSQEGLTTGNKLHRKPTAPPTIRFEMPFAVWCLHCTPHPVIIGQGVRFNAVKKRVGAYHTTPVWAFTMRHNVCRGALEIRTDPARSEYVCASGCRRREEASAESLRARDGEEGEGREILTDREREALRRDAFGRLERTIADREALKSARGRLEALERQSERDWGDDYGRNRALRRTFRVGRKERERTEGGKDALRERLGWGEEKVVEEEREEDGVRASLVEFRAIGEDQEEKALTRPLFGGKGGRENGFRGEVMGNTRAGRDPFLKDGGREGRMSLGRIPGVKRKRSPMSSQGDEGGAEKKRGMNGEGKEITEGLVDYASDSE